MALRDWIETPAGKAATAATTATPTADLGLVVATVATVAMNPASQEAPNSPHYRWLILEPDGGRKEICVLPEMTVADLAPCYPGARLLALSDSASEAGVMIG